MPSRKWELRSILSDRALLSAGNGHGGDLEHLADRLIADESGPHERGDDAVLLLARYEGADGDGAPRRGNLHIQRRDLHGVKTARDVADDRLRAWSLAEMSDTFQLVAIEIVTNALIHAGSDVDIRLRAFDDHLRLEVRDSDSNPPVPSPLALSEEEKADAEHGRGLLIVEALGRHGTAPPTAGARQSRWTCPSCGADSPGCVVFVDLGRPVHQGPDPSPAVMPTRPRA
ncbi:ATP-binding protein [Streptomyces sp. NPDC093984]|uniref:ATP-binding protein n=1 Tax=Streptomyces sp. NPDC093984 TaxID=3366052 RepID=UPI003826A344